MNFTVENDKDLINIQILKANTNKETEEYQLVMHIGSGYILISIPNKSRKTK